MLVESINDLNLHDSELIEVRVSGDIVSMFLNYIESYDPFQISPKVLIFSGCREIHFKTNPGFDSPNSILGGEEILSKNGRRVRIETNTTASIIEIVADNIRLEETHL